MSNILATDSMAGRLTQPSWSCARIRSGITADCCRPGGYFAIVDSAQARFSGENAKPGGWISSAARRRTDMRLLHRLAVLRFDLGRLRRLGNKAQDELVALLQQDAGSGSGRHHALDLVALRQERLHRHSVLGNGNTRGEDHRCCGNKKFHRSTSPKTMSSEPSTAL